MTSRALHWLAVWLLVLAGALHAPFAHALETPEEQDRRAQEIIRSTMSPFCPGRTLDSCPSPNATDWRNDVRAWVAEGVTTEQIRERLDRRVPDYDLTGAPSTLLDAVLPILIVVIALSLLALLLRALLNSRRKPEPSPASSVAPRELDQRIDDELARLDD